MERQLLGCLAGYLPDLVVSCGNAEEELASLLTHNIAYSRIAGASFVGLFLARFSRVRTVGEVFLYSLVAPVFLLHPVVFCVGRYCHSPRSSGR